jgi:hypothetical protein
MKLALTSRYDSRQLPAAALFSNSGKRHAASLRSYWLTLVMLLQLATAATAQAAERPVVREVLVSREGNGARIEIRANQPLIYRSYLMSGLEKWVVDLPGARTTFSGDESKKMRTPPLERITVRQKDFNGDPLTRIGLDFKGEIDFSLKQDPLDKGHLIILMKPSLSSPQKRAAEASPPAASKVLSPE